MYSVKVHWDQVMSSEIRGKLAAGMGHADLTLSLNSYHEQTREDSFRDCYHWTAWPYRLRLSFLTGRKNLPFSPAGRHLYGDWWQGRYPHVCVRPTRCLDAQKRAGYRTHELGATSPSGRRSVHRQWADLGLQRTGSGLHSQALTLCRFVTCRNRTENVWFSFA